MTNYERYRAKRLADPEFAKGYEQAKKELDIAYALLEARENLNISQKELSKRTGVKQSNISRFESGRHSPTISTLQKIADGLGMSLNVEFIQEANTSNLNRG